MNTYSKLIEIKKNAGRAYFQNRIAAEMLYLLSLSETEKGIDRGLLSDVCDRLYLRYTENGALTAGDVKEAEDSLSSLSPIAKSRRAHLVAHAHIDMNWMWGIQETTAVVLDTVRTMLGFMRDYPEFTFSQSQAAVYEIIEKYDPEMLSEIKERIKEGRWEVTASTWVEHDKNMADAESQCRQIMYTKKYLSELLDIPASSLDIDFEPDTFGHSENVPTVLSAGGIKYYYHCRGLEGYTLYNWEAPSGERVLAYREPKWYNADIDPYILSDMPLMTEKFGISDMLLVYGVGDHGGGPTRRDIESLRDMMSWPLYPSLEFSSYKNFFRAIEPHRDNFPTHKGENNFVFTGCYTTQSRIKRANKFAESRLYDSEMLSAAAFITAGHRPDMKAYESAWRNTLFNQFHDILPGSGMNDTREYALGLYQQTLALSNNEEQKAVRAIAALTDTSAVEMQREKDGGESEGAGVGYSASHVQGYLFPETERGYGKTRIVHAFNTTAYRRRESVELVLFDYHFPLSLLKVTNGAGESVPFSVIEDGAYYWKHHTTKLLLSADIPPFSYETYVVSQRDDDSIPVFSENITHRVHHITDEPVVLENNVIKAVFSKTHMTLDSLTDKRTGEELVTEKSGRFELIKESNKRGESSWIVSEFMSLESLNEAYPVKYLGESHSEWFSMLKYYIEFGDSNIEATVTLKKDSPLLEYDIWVNWTHPGSRATYIPQLRFSIGQKAKTENYIYDIPMGKVSRPPLGHDVPAISYQFAGGEHSGIILTSAEKYGFRGYNDTMSLDLLRSSFDPDPYPELGRHQIKFAVGAASDAAEARETAIKYRHPPVRISDTPHTGTLPLSGAFLEVFGCEVSSVKVAETENAVIIRVYSLSDGNGNGKIRFPAGVRRAHICDINEKTTEPCPVSGNEVTFRLPAHGIVTVKAEFV